MAEAANIVQAHSKRELAHTINALITSKPITPELSKETCPSSFETLTREGIHEHELAQLNGRKVLYLTAAASENSGVERFSNTTENANFPQSLIGFRAIRLVRQTCGGCRPQSRQYTSGQQLKQRKCGPQTGPLANYSCGYNYSFPLPYPAVRARSPSSYRYRPIRSQRRLDCRLVSGSYQDEWRLSREAVNAGIIPKSHRAHSRQGSIATSGKLYPGNLPSANKEQQKETALSKMSSAGHPTGQSVGVNTELGFLDANVNSELVERGHLGMYSRPGPSMGVPGLAPAFMASLPYWNDYGWVNIIGGGMYGPYTGIPVEPPLDLHEGAKAYQKTCERRYSCQDIDRIEKLRAHCDCVKKCKAELNVKDSSTDPKPMDVATNSVSQTPELPKNTPAKPKPRKKGKKKGALLEKSKEKSKPKKGENAKTRKNNK